MKHTLNFFLNKMIIIFTFLMFNRIKTTKINNLILNTIKHYLDLSVTRLK